MGKNSDPNLSWVKIYRKLLDSDIWEMPPVYLKLWIWLLLKVDYQTGNIRRTGPQIAEAIQWVENRRPFVPHRKAIHRALMWMEKEGMLHATKDANNSPRRYYDITIYNWTSYQSAIYGLAPSENGNLPRKSASKEQEVQIITGSRARAREENRVPKDLFEKEICALWSDYIAPGEPLPWNYFDLWREQQPSDEIILDAARHAASSGTEIRKPLPYMATLFPLAAAGKLSTQGNTSHGQSDSYRSPGGLGVDFGGLLKVYGSDRAE